MIEKITQFLNKGAQISNWAQKYLNMYINLETFVSKPFWNLKNA
jgi:hypothetical protein